ncbi:hypothetical protein, partial [Nocardioides fonticola]|uniref:hypothetical protein n=1 Tax=Nocardioides fonticola TaxID=450363 RepID=UPI0031D87088
MQNVSGAAGVQVGDGRIVLTYQSLTAQAVSFTSTAPSSPGLGSTYDVSATGGGSGNPVVFSVGGSPAGVCTISGSRVTFAHAGSCVISANQAGGDGYAAAKTATQTITVAKAAQEVQLVSAGLT